MDTTKSYLKKYILPNIPYMPTLYLVNICFLVVSFINYNFKIQVKALQYIL